MYCSIVVSCSSFLFSLLVTYGHRRIYHCAIWAMPPPLDSEKFLHMVKNATLEKFDSRKNS